IGSRPTTAHSAPRMPPAARRRPSTARFLDDTRVQLVVVSKHALGRVVQELVRILPGVTEAVQDASVQHVSGTVALENPHPYAGANLFHHVALGLEFGSRHRRTGGR